MSLKNLLSQTHSLKPLKFIAIPKLIDLNYCSEGADLTGSVLAGSVLAGAVLAGAVLAGADLTDAFLAGSFLTGALLTSPHPLTAIKNKLINKIVKKLFTLYH